MARRMIGFFNLAGKNNIMYKLLALKILGVYDPDEISMHASYSAASPLTLTLATVMYRAGIY